jgi:hypothetical protein
MSTRCLNFDHQINRVSWIYARVSSNSFLLMHIYSNFSQAEKEMIVKVFRGISKDFAELTKTAQMEKTADYAGIDF